jgi:hypothetical protein
VTTLNEQAIRAIIEQYRVDLTSWLNKEAPGAHRNESAYAVIMIQKHIMNTEASIIRDLEYLRRTVDDDLKAPSMFSAGTIMSTAQSLLRHQTRLGTLLDARDLAMLPFLIEE